MNPWLAFLLGMIFGAMLLVLLAAMVASGKEERRILGRSHEKQDLD